MDTNLYEPAPNATVMVPRDPPRPRGAASTASQVPCVSGRSLSVMSATAVAGSCTVPTQFGGTVTLWAWVPPCEDQDERMVPYSVHRDAAAVFTVGAR